MSVMTTNDVTDAPAGPPLATIASREIFARIVTHGPIGRVEVGRQTGLSAAKVTKTVKPLIEAGYVTVADEAPASTGRPVYPLSVAPRSMLAIGVKVNADEVVAIVLTLGNDIVSSARRALPATGVSDVVEAVAATVEGLLGELESERDRIAGVGVSVSGDVDRRTGTVRDSPLLGWTNVPLGELLRQRIRLPFVVSNDVQALTYVEDWFGIGVDATSFAIVTIGAGIGCGLYLNGEVVGGAHGVAGEIGHLPLADPGALCVCGRYGCVEAVASSGAILAAVRAAHGDDTLDLADAVRLAHRGDATATAAFDRAGSAIGAGLAAMVNLVGPETVLVAGEGVADFDLYEQRIRGEFAAHAFGAAADCEIVLRRHTFDDWARGAAVCVLRRAILGAD